MIRRFAALFAGFVTAMVVVVIFDLVSARFYPLPEGLDPKDPSQRQAFIDHVKTLPLPAFCLVLAGQALGTFFGALGAAFMAREHIPRICGTLGATMLVLSLFNQYNIPHPTWFAIASPLAILAMAFLAYRVACRMGLDAPPEESGGPGPAGPLS